MRQIQRLVATVAMTASTAGALPLTDKPLPCPETTPFEQCRSFSMRLTGRNGRPPHPNDVKFVAGTVVGGLVGRLSLRKYHLYEKFPDGGFFACIEPTETGYRDAMAEFNSFRVGSDSMWDVQAVLSCTGGQ